MEIRNSKTTSMTPVSKKTILTGKIISYLCILFLLFDSVTKIIRESHSVDGSVKLGWPDSGVQGLGIVLLICTILYAIPRTAILGAVLITAYLGGAVAIMFRAGEPFYFPPLFGVMVWAGLWLRNEKLRTLMPIVKD